VGFVEQVEVGGIGGPALEIQAQGLVQRIPVPLGKRLQIAGAPAAAQDPQYRHQQQKPLGVTHPAAVAAIGNGLEEADQIIRRAQISCSGDGFGHRER
jgi:hypothetical protein